MPTKLSNSETQTLLTTLKSRFEKNSTRHKDFSWSKVQEKLEKNTNKLETLSKMEKTGGEPDVIDFDKNTKEFLFCDCSEESPKERRSLCYDTKSLNDRKENKPKDSAENMAKEIGIEILTVEEYKYLQTLGKFDTKTSSWLKTPEKIRKLGGAIFGDRRYDTIFTYHNGAESYYASRGFRGILRI